jgi:hypothetical protein
MLEISKQTLGELGKQIIEGLKEFIDVSEKGESLEDKFRITKITKKKDGTYKIKRTKPKK